MLSGHPQAILDVRQIDGGLNAMARHLRTRSSGLGFGKHLVPTGSYSSHSDTEKPPRRLWLGSPVLVFCGYLVSHDVIIRMNTMSIRSGPRTGHCTTEVNISIGKYFQKKPGFAQLIKVTTHGWLSSDF